MILTATITPATPAQAIALPVFRTLARAAAAAHLDALLFRRSGAVALDAQVLIAALAAEELFLGLGASVPIDVLEPFHIARSFAAIDRLTNGRSAILLDTGADLPAACAHAALTGDLPARRIELISVVRKLLDSWEDEALLVDRPGGLFTDPDRIHRINHDGAHYAVRGPLNAPRPLQGMPVIFAPLGTDPELAVAADILLVDPVKEPVRLGAVRLLADLAPVPRETAEMLAARVRNAMARGFDGCNMQVPVDPGALEVFLRGVALLAPSPWRGGTLRARLGLARLPSQFAA